MKVKNWVRFVFVAATAALVSDVCFAYKDKGFQYWSAVGVSSDINKDWRVDFEQEFRMGDDGGNLYYEHSDLGFVYKGLADWIDLGFNYRQIYEKDTHDHFQPENRPHLNVTLKTKLFGLPFSDRSRLEYRDRDNLKDIWRYRNKVELKFPEMTPLKLQPYVGDDMFIDLDARDFTKNWLFSGVSFKLSKTVGADIYYMWEAKKGREEWTDIHILGTKLKFRF